MNKTVLPEKYKVYNCYDDGKVTQSRKYKVLIVDIIPIEKCNSRLKNLCNNAILEYDLLYKPDQQYVVIGVSYEQDIPTIEIFLGTLGNSWFGIGDWDQEEQCFNNMWNSGLLDVEGKFYNS